MLTDFLEFTNRGVDVRKGLCYDGRNELKTYTLVLEELEEMLLTDFGGKLQPVDYVKLSKQKLHQANAAAFKTKFIKSKG